MNWGDFFEAFSGLLGAYDTYDSGQQRKKQNKAIANAAEANAEADKQRKADALRRGVMEADRSAQRKRALVGKQRAAMGASGVAVDQGTFGAVTDDTYASGKEDEDTIMQNSLREAWGYQVSADNETARAKAARGAASDADTSSWFGGLGSLAAGTYSYGKKRNWWDPPKNDAPGQSEAQLRWAGLM